MPAKKKEVAAPGDWSDQPGVRAQTVAERKAVGRQIRRRLKSDSLEDKERELKAAALELLRERLEFKAAERAIREEVEAEDPKSVLRKIVRKQRRS